MVELPSGRDYDARFERLARQGQYLHGEADFVSSLGASRVLDAGCGTGRLAIELARRGVEVTGVDVEPSMIDQARAKAPELDWRLGDLATVDLEPDAYDLAVMAGNVLLFTAPGTEGAVVANLASSVARGGAVVAGFQLESGRYDLASYDAACGRAGLVLTGRWATWDRAALPAERVTYAVSLHRRR
jgi:SAM-dependent methyltransferase